MKKILVFVFLVLISLNIFAVSAPSVSSSSHSNQNNWYNVNDISLSWSSDASTYSFVLDNESGTVPSETVSSSTSIIYHDKKPDTYYFHVRGKSGSDWSETTHFKINIDNLGPSRPQDLAGEALDDGSIKISWAASEDSGSGVSHYALYRSVLRYVPKGGYLAEFSIRDAVAVLIAEDIAETSYVDSSVLDGGNYHYRVQPVDNAGNIGSVSAIFSVKAASFCDASFEASFALDEENFSGTFYANDAEVKRVKIFLVYPDSFEEAVFDGGNASRESIDINVDFSSLNEGLYVFKLQAEDLEGDDCSAEENFFFDTHSPAVSIISPSGDASLEETVSVIVSVSDSLPSSGIDRVEFYWDEEGFKKIGEVFDSEDDQYTFSWNTLNQENSRSKLKVKAFDMAGNYGEAELIFTIKNTLNLKHDINALYSRIDSLQEELNEIKVLLSLFSFDSEKIDSLKIESDLELIESKKLFDSGIDFAKSKRHAQSAVDLMEQAKNAVKIEKKPAINYSFTRADLNSLYYEAGLLPEFVPDSVENILASGYSRRLFLYKISDENYSKYFALIEISLYNGSTESKQVKLIEPVSQEFASGKEMVYSANELTWLEEDFVFVTDLDLNAETTTTLAYILNSPVALFDLNRISNSINSFSVPSIIVSADAKIPPKIFYPPLIPGTGTLFNSVMNAVSLNGAIPSWVIWLVLGIILLLVIGAVLVAGIAVYFLFFRKKKGLRR
ncbi:MAG: fibronectin type III domain-containing protein [Candidatus Diapherotrites archaeon]